MAGVWDSPPTEDEKRAASGTPGIWDAPPTAEETEAAGPDPAVAERRAARAQWDKTAAAMGSDRYQPSAPETPDEERKAAYLKWQAEHSELTPDQAASAVKLAAATGYPVNLVLADLPRFQREAAARKTDWDALAKDHPPLADFLLADPARLALAKDDSANLHGFAEALVGRWEFGTREDYAKGDARLVHDVVPPVWYAWSRDHIKEFFRTVPAKVLYAATAPSITPRNEQELGVLRGQYAAAGGWLTDEEEAIIRQRWADDAHVRFLVEHPNIARPPTDEELKRFQALAPAPDEPWRAELRQKIEEWSADDPSRKDYGPWSRTTLGRVVLAPFGLAPMIAGNVAAMAAGAAVGGPEGAFAAGVAYNSVVNFGPLAYELQNLKDGEGNRIDPGTANGAAAAASVLGAVVMQVGVGGIAQKLGGEAMLRSAVTRAGARLLTEKTTGDLLGKAFVTFGKDEIAGVLAMGIQAGANRAAEVATSGQGDAGDVAEAAFQGATQAIPDLLILAGIGAGRAYLADRGARLAAQDNANGLRALNDTARASELLNKSPEEAAKLIAQLRANAGLEPGQAVDTVYADLEGFQRYFQEQKLDPRAVAAEVMGDGGKAYDEAVASKAADLAIPVEKYATTLAVAENGKHAAGLAPDLKLAPDVNTPRQEAVELKTRAERMKKLAATPRDRMEEDQGKVFDSYKAQALAAGEPEKVATANAQLYSSALQVLAERAGRGETAWDMWEANALQIHQGEPAAPPAMAAAAQGPVLKQGERVGEIEGAPLRLHKEGDRGFIDVSPSKPGEGAPVRFSLHLLNADRSTLAHESFHALSVLMGQVSTRGDAPAPLRAEYQKLLDVMGYKDHGERVTSPLAKNEEKASHLWEMYLSEGRAPSADLLPAFARFRAWMGRIYRGAEKIAAQYEKTYKQKIEMSDDVRALFGRMLAGDDAVASAAHELRLETPKVTLTPEEQAESDRLLAEARAAAEIDLQQQMVKEGRDTDAEFMKHARAEVQVQTEKRLMAEDRLFAAQTALEKGELDGIPAKLDRASVREEFGGEVLQQIPKRYIAEAGGLPSDALADMLRFPSGAEMVKALVDGESRAARLKREVAAAMAELYPRLQDRPALLRDTARAALNNDALLRDGILRLRAMEREAGLRPSRADLKGLKAAAADAVEGKTIAELRPDRLDAAARTYARRASEVKDPELRRDAFEAYLFNQAMAHAARQARARAEKTARFLQGFTTDKKRAQLGKAVITAPDGTQTQPFLEKVDGLLDAFEFRAASLKDVRSRDVQKAALDHWVKERWADGDSVVIPESVLENLGRSKHWKDLTVGELEDLRDAVESIAEQARLRRSFLSHVGAVDTEQVINELVASALANGSKVEQHLNDESIRTKREKLNETGRQAKHMAEHPELVFEELDGHKTDGPWTKYVWNTLSDASYRFYDLVRGSNRQIQALLEGLSMTDRLRLKNERFKVDGNMYTLENAIAVGLNFGNDSNRQKTVRGMSDPRVMAAAGIKIPWYGQTTAEKILAHLTQKDVDLINEIHRTLEAQRPAMEALEKQDKGIAPKWVKGKPFRFKGADGKELTIDGGYYPMLYAKKTRVGKGQAEAEAAAANGLPGLFQPGYETAITPQSHLQARVENFARPIDLTLSRLPMTLTKEAKDIAFRIPAKQLYRVLIDERVAGALHQALGDKGHELVMKHLQDSVNDVMLPDAGEGLALKAISFLRARTFEAIFGGNIPQALQNLADWAGVAAVVPTKYAMDAALRLARHPEIGKAEILALSPEMRIRADGMKSLAADLQSTFRKWEITLKWEHAQHLLMIPFETTQAMVELPVWRGAYDHATTPKEKGGLGLSQEEAVRHADGAIRTLSGGKRTVDLTPIQRSKITRHFTMFWGWAGAQLNMFIQARGRSGKAWSEGMKWRALGIVGKSFALLSAKMLLSELLTGKGPQGKKNDDGTEEPVHPADVARWVGFKSLFALPGTFPIVGSLARGMSEPGPQRDMSLTPWTNVFNAASKAIQKSTRAAASPDELDEDQELDLFLAWLEAGGSISGGPVAQTRATVGYWKARPEGATALTDVLGTIYGRDRAGKLSHLTVKE